MPFSHWSTRSIAHSCVNKSAVVRMRNPALLAYLYVTGIDVNASPPKRNPSTARDPDVTEKRAKPRFAVIPASPGCSRRTRTALPRAATFTVVVPIALPSSANTAIVTDAAALLVFTTATAVVKVVSSQVISAVCQD